MLINASVTASTTCLILHSKGLQIAQVYEGNTHSSSINVVYEPENEWAVITFASAFQVNSNVAFSVPFKFVFVLLIVLP